MNAHDHDGATDRDARSITSDECGQRVVLFTRRGCHLCDDAQRMLEAHGITPKCVDIDVDPQLRARFDTCVPVVEIDGRIRFRGRVDAVQLRRILRNR
jgi:glutaredoxin